MSDLPIDLPSPESLDTAVSIPPALAAGKGRRVKKDRAQAVPFEPAPATFPAQEPHPTAAAPADHHFEEPTMATTIENMTETATAKTQAHFADMNTHAKNAMEKSGQFFTEMTSFTKGNVEAMVESGRIAASGMQTMAQDAAAYARKQMEEATAAARTLTSVKSPTEFVKLQGDYVRQQFDGAVAEMSRSTEAMLKLAGEVVQPISNRVAVAVEKIKQAA